VDQWRRRGDRREEEVAKVEDGSTAVSPCSRMATGALAAAMATSGGAEVWSGRGRGSDLLM